MVKLRLEVDKELYNKYKDLVKRKSNSFIGPHNVLIFKDAITKEIERLNQLPDMIRRD